MKNLSLSTLISWLLLGCLLISCSSNKGIVKFSPKKSDVFTKQELRTFLKLNPKPKIVLRVPNSSNSTTSEEAHSQSQTYNAIENELLKNGFEVRDRGLFNEILSKTQTDDYSKIRELTDTDLILELINLKTDVEYTTNTYFTPKKNKEKTVKKGNITLYGATVEFKLIMVSDNQLSGSYQFNYAPCTAGCEYLINKRGKLSSLSGKRVKNPKYELVENVFLVDFMKEATRELIASMRER